MWSPTAAPHSLNIKQGVESYGSTQFTQYRAGCGILEQHSIHSIQNRMCNHVAAPHSLKIQQGMESYSSSPFTQYSSLFTQYGIISQQSIYLINIESRVG